ncbi:MAG: hypothetical protein P9L94_17735 [Candidatus Hinthialibacter antarcticus]|nr:hypothetical protein [Candidatus Hinthialibacter antarcticus]
MKTLLACIVIVCSITFTPIAADYPQTTLSNDAMEMLIYLPDAENGYYRGSRFEWSGLIQQIKYAGHTYFGDWKSTHDPENHDDLAGTASEFGMFTPLGYDDAKRGETFVKIGIGELQRINTSGYQFHTNYEVATAYDWTINSTSNSIEFIQESPGFKGWKYHFEKRIQLAEGAAPRFSIYHKIVNTGSNPINTDYYCHNFTIIDDDPIGPAYTLEFPFELQFPQSLNGYAKAEGKTVQFLKPLKNTSIYAEFEGYEVAPENTGVTIYNQDRKAGIKINGDYGAYEFHYWSTTLATCPEPFLKIDIEPGESIEWTDEYELIAENGINQTQYK